MSEDLAETLVWALTDRTQESNEQWEVGQTFFLGQQVKIVAERGESDNGYVALDSIFMDDVHCSPFPEDASPNMTSTTPSPPTIRNCDFQENFCDWSPMGEEFIWERSRGSQENGTDGPSEDREGSRESEALLCPSPLYCV